MDSVGDGFEIQLVQGQKVIPTNHPVERSIITLSVDPTCVKIIESYGKLKVHFEDGSGQEFSFLPLTDLGFHQNAVNQHEADRLEEVNDLIHNQDEVFLRVGLSRVFSSPDGRNGYWLQVNGIYTFPHYHEGIRCYT